MLKRFIYIIYYIYGAEKSPRKKIFTETLGRVEKSNWIWTKQSNSNHKFRSGEFFNGYLFAHSPNILYADEDEDCARALRRRNFSIIFSSFTVVANMQR